MNPLLLRNWVKRFINATIHKFILMIPEVEKTTKTSKLTDEIFTHLLVNVGYQPKKYYKDKNFPRLLETARKTLIFLIETDNHYEKWVGYFYIQTMLKMNRLYEEWEKQNFRLVSPPTFEDFVKWFLETK